MPRKRILGIAAIAVVVVAVAAAVLWTRGSVRSGPGPYAAQLELCRERVAQDIQHIDHEHIDSTVWRSGDEAELRIGGKFTVLGDNNQRAVHEYECLVRNLRVIRTEVW